MHESRMADLIFVGDRHQAISFWGFVLLLRIMVNDEKLVHTGIIEYHEYIFP